MSECREPDCGKPVDARNLCHKHYERWRRTGSTAEPVQVRVDPSVRFASKFELDPTTGCHVWTAARDQNGYGLFRVNRKQVVRAHIFAWEQANGRPVPEGLELDHIACDRPPCVNPDHVRPATARENSLRSRNACANNARKTHCPQGHPYEVANTWRTARGFRLCKACCGERQRAYRARKKAKA